VGMRCHRLIISGLLACVMAAARWTTQASVVQPGPIVQPVFVRFRRRKKDQMPVRDRYGRLLAAIRYEEIRLETRVPE